MHCKNVKLVVIFFRSLGVEVRVLKADEAFPDCVFVEDPAIVVEGTRPGVNPINFLA